jgi:hyperosmotically inducible periplasmic protein
MMCTRVFLSIAFCAASMAVAQTSDPSTQPDNTKINQRDRDPNQPTADQQKNNRSDRMLTKDIRRSIMADKSLSTNAHNVKIISQNGTVTVKGPVNSDDERRAVIAKAVAVAGSADKVTDQISVKQ